MAETVRVVVDAMGGDNAPAEPVKAAVEAVAEREDIDVILTGRQDVIEKELSKFQNYPKERIQIVNTTEVIETAEPPVLAIRKKKDSSIVVGLNLVKKLRRHFSRWSGDRRKKQRSTASAAGTLDSYPEWCVTSY